MYKTHEQIIKVHQKKSQVMPFIKKDTCCLHILVFYLQDSMFDSQMQIQTPTHCLDLDLSEVTPQIFLPVTKITRLLMMKDERYNSN